MHLHVCIYFSLPRSVVCVCGFRARCRGRERARPGPLALVRLTGLLRQERSVRDDSAECAYAGFVLSDAAEWAIPGKYRIHTHTPYALLYCACIMLCTTHTRTLYTTLQASALLVSVKRKELRTPSGGGKNMKTKGSSSSREKKAKGQKHN
jgi:hypothetical protein